MRRAAIVRTVAVVQARIGSTRCPGKVLAEIGGQSMIARVVERARAMTLVDEVVVAVPGDEQSLFSELLPDTCVYGGEPEDVLARYRSVAAQAHASLIVRLTADCPLLDSAEADRVVALLREAGGDLDYASNVYPKRTVPDGFDVEAFTWEALLLAALHAPAGSTREHVTGWMREHLRCGSVASCSERMTTYPWWDLKLSVDEVRDYVRVRRVLAASSPNAGMVDLVAMALRTR